MLVQVNAGYFLDPKTVRSAVKNLKKGKIHLIGSDCHNMLTRYPNLEAARMAAKKHGAEAEFLKLAQNAEDLLFPDGMP